MDVPLQRLYELQTLDSRIAGIERTIEAIPGRVRAIRDEHERARTALETVRGTLERVRKDLRAREKDLDYQASQRAKSEAKLYEVKTNKEYSAILAEIETLKAEKGRLEEEILALMEAQERMAAEVREAETRFRRQEEEARGQEAAAHEELRALEAEVAGLRTERDALAREVPRHVLEHYARLLRGRAGLAVAVIGRNGICSGCRVALTPQRFQEVRHDERRSGHLLTCESCGRILYYQP